MAQTKVGWRPYVATTTTTASTLLTSIYGVWNADTLGTSLDTSIYAAYNAENNANDSVGTKHGTAQGSLTYTTGKVGNAFQFNGSNAYVQLPNNSFNFTGDCSVSLWVNFPSMSFQNCQLIDNTCFDTSGVGTSGWRLYYLYGSLGFYNFRENNMVLLESMQLNQANVWYHVVITTSSSGMKIYLNGSLSASNTTTQRPNYPNTVSTKLGASRSNNQFFTGKMDGVTVWDKSLTANEVTNLYNLGTGVEYPFSSKTLPSPNDAVSANHGTLMNGCTFAAGKIGQAFTFDGVNDVVTLPTNTMKFTNNFTISLWFNVNASDGMLFSNYHNDGSGDYGYFLHKTGSNLRWQVYSSGNLNNKTVTIPSYVTNTWFHVVVTANNTVENGFSNAIYINGSLAGYNTYMDNIRYHSTINHYPSIGAMYYGSSPTISNPFNGKIDAVNIWNRKLTSTEITELYNAGTGKQYPYVVGAPSSLLTNLYAIYKGENNANDLLGNYNGTAVGGLTYTAGKSGNAFTFNGTNAYVSLPTNQFNFTGDFTISAWVNISGLYIGSNVIHLMTNLNCDGAWFQNLKGIWFQIAGQTLALSLFNSGTANDVTWNDTTGSIIKAGSGWFHVVATRKGGTGSKIYLNGVLKNSNTNTLDANFHTNYQTPVIGNNRILNRSGAVATSDVYAPNGVLIDEYNVWTKELTSTDVTTLYNSGAGKFYPTF